MNNQHKLIAIKSLIDYTSYAKNKNRERIAIILGAILIVAFMVEDLSLLPESLTNSYLINRLAFQVPLLLIVFAMTFHRNFENIRGCIFAAVLLLETWLNYGFIYIAWADARFMFPYEGAILYALYCIFLLDVPFKLTIIVSILNLSVFAGLMMLYPIYGERTLIATGFIAGSLLIVIYTKFRVDKTFEVLRQSNQKLVELSATDDLTKLFNRRAFFDEASTLLSICQRENLSFSVLMIDIDEFKQYNDAFGHQHGDKVIVAQAEILTGIFKRTGDLVGRYGGEEYIVALSGIDIEKLKLRCLSINEAWKSQAISHSNKAEAAYVNCSIGAVCCENILEKDLDSLIEIADKNLYIAKNSGKGTHHLTHELP